MRRSSPPGLPTVGSIAYIAPQNNAGLLVKYSLMLLDVASGVSTERYATTDTTLARPTWSPDSRRIAFEVATYRGAWRSAPVKDTAIARPRCGGRGVAADGDHGRHEARWIPIVAPDG